MQKNRKVKVWKTKLIKGLNALKGTSEWKIEFVGSKLTEVFKKKIQKNEREYVALKEFSISIEKDC